jgi:hypothetical protein
LLNIETARFDCTFGRGCEGVCCRDGRPPVYPEDARQIDGNLDRILPLLRPEARAAVADGGYVSRRRKAGQRMARVVAGWCVFFNHGCTLHHLGAAEGAPFRYKPWLCAVFPLAKDAPDRWYVRQKDYKKESWDLPCLDPRSSIVPAAISLQHEVAMVEEWESSQRLAGQASAGHETLPIRRDGPPDATEASSRFEDRKPRRERQRQDIV